MAEARAAYADPKIRSEALTSAAEALPLDNEGLRVAEAHGHYAATRRAKKKARR